MTPETPPTAPTRPGRRRVTSPNVIERAAFELFERQGFETTTVEEIASSAGIARRTFFRYFDSKNDVVWGDFTGQLDLMRRWFADSEPQEPVLCVIRRVVVEFNRVPDGEVSRHRRRLRLLLGVPALQAHSTLRFAQWRAVIAEFVAERTGSPVDALVPQALAHATLGVAIAAYQRWLDDADVVLCEVLDDALAQLVDGFPALAA